MFLKFQSTSFLCPSTRPKENISHPTGTDFKPAFCAEQKNDYFQRSGPKFSGNAASTTAGSGHRKKKHKPGHSRHSHERRNNPAHDPNSRFPLPVDENAYDGDDDEIGSVARSGRNTSQASTDAPGTSASTTEPKPEPTQGDKDWKEARYLVRKLEKVDMVTINPDRNGEVTIAFDQDDYEKLQNDKDPNVDQSPAAMNIKRIDRSDISWQDLLAQGLIPNFAKGYLYREKSDKTHRIPRAARINNQKSFPIWKYKWVDNDGDYKKEFKLPENIRYESKKTIRKQLQRKFEKSTLEKVMIDVDQNLAVFVFQDGKSIGFRDSRIREANSHPERFISVGEFTPIDYLKQKFGDGGARYGEGNLYIFNLRPPRDNLFGRGAQYIWTAPEDIEYAEYHSASSTDEETEGSATNNSSSDEGSNSFDAEDYNSPDAYSGSEMVEPSRRDTFPTEASGSRPSRRHHTWSGSLPPQEYPDNPFEEYYEQTSRNHEPQHMRRELRRQQRIWREELERQQQEQAEQEEMRELMSRVSFNQPSPPVQVDLEKWRRMNMRRRPW